MARPQTPIPKPPRIRLDRLRCILADRDVVRCRKVWQGTPGNVNYQLKSNRGVVHYERRCFGTTVRETYEVAVEGKRRLTFTVTDSFTLALTHAGGRQVKDSVNKKIPLGMRQHLANLISQVSQHVPA